MGGTVEQVEGGEYGQRQQEPRHPGARPAQGIPPGRRHCGGAQAHRPRHHGWRGLLHLRHLGLGQVHAAQPARRPGEADARLRLHRRRPYLSHERKRARGLSPEVPGVHLPGLQPPACADRHRKRGVAPRFSRHAQAQARGTGTQDARPRGPGQPSRPFPQPDVGRPAAARGHRARLRDAAARDVCRRAHRQPRLEDDGRGHADDLRFCARPRPDHRARDARPQHGGLRRPHRHAHRRSHRERRAR